MKFLRTLALALAAFAATGASADWAVCAREGEICRFNGRHEVSFGAGKSWNTRTYTDGVACTTERFGDPAPGQKKSCQINLSSGGGGGATQWVDCAREDGFCRFDGKREVAYGANGRFFTKVFVNGVKCGNQAFGGDPIPGVAKICRVRVPEGQAPSATIDGSWIPCAVEGRICQFSGRRKVAYGANGRVFYRMAENSIACTNERFGGDPTPGVAKRCWFNPN